MHDAYLDANAYLAYFLGEAEQEKVRRLLDVSLGCRFSLTASAPVFGEVQHVSGNRSSLLIQQFLDSLQSRKKLKMVPVTLQDVEWADLQDEKTGFILGFNDWMHVRLASKYSDVLVSNDRTLKQLSVPWVRCETIETFLESLKP
ncbi:type II toxin-antitoxin system VapC family toxin [Candidatus Micrarchaeota archaeon]|nr:type II toxin-antitoxin system VapC family toxin [Candidatus Micrarchaeota archaeon]